MAGVAASAWRGGWGHAVGAHAGAVGALGAPTPLRRSALGMHRQTPSTHFVRCGQTQPMSMSTKRAGARHPQSRSSPSPQKSPPAQPLPSPAASTTRSCWGKRLNRPLSVRAPAQFVGHFSLFPQTQAGGAAKARVGRVWSANQDGSPELAGFVARVRSTLRELTVADCLTTTNEVSGGSFGDGPRNQSAQGSHRPPGR